MSHTTISKTRSGRALLDYVLDEKAHNGIGVRNQLIVPVNLASGNAESYGDQMAAVWCRRSSKNKNEARHVITSFSKKELDPNDPADWMLAGAICQEFVEQNYPGFQAIIAIQTDGKGGCVHGHIVINNTRMDDFKGCTDEQTKAWFVRQKMDDIISKHMEIDHGKEQDVPEKIGEKSMRDKDGKYVWKDDLRDRILRARDAAKDFDDFMSTQLPAVGVSAEYHPGGTKRTGKVIDPYITYKLEDVSGFGDGKIPENLKSRSNKLGTEFGPEGLEKAWQKGPVVTQPVIPVPPAPVFTVPEVRPTDDGYMTYDEWAQQHGFTSPEDLVLHFDDYRADKEAAAQKAKEPPVEVPEQPAAEMPVEPPREEPPQESFDDRRKREREEILQRQKQRLSEDAAGEVENAQDIYRRMREQAQNRRQKQGDYGDE